MPDQLPPRRQPATISGESVSARPDDTTPDPLGMLAWAIAEEDRSTESGCDATTRHLMRVLDRLELEQDASNEDDDPRARRIHADATALLEALAGLDWRR